jgi:penicillin-binding protein 1A
MNFKHFKYDMVKQGKRQIGSTFKPFVYAAAIDQLHLSPCEKFPDTPYCIEAGKYGNPKEWCPKNATQKYGGLRTLKNALANSVNTVTARLIDRVGPQIVVDLAKKLGIESDILPVPSIALGTPDLSVYEMVGAYSTFANKGVYTKPVMVTSIEDKNGTILYQFKPETRDVLNEETAYVTVKLMEGVTQFGSGASLRHIYKRDRPEYKEVVTGYPYEFKNPIAGKTGTTQNQSDGWFMGMVPNLVTGVWVGAEDRAAHFGSITYGQGGVMALPIWGLYMKSCYADETLGISKEDFEEPLDLSINVDCSKVNDKTIDDPRDDEVPDDLDFN